MTEHPLIRTHPVTSYKSVFFNPGFVTQIVGIPKAESNAIIAYLNELITTTQEIHVRYQWRKNDVAFWDNRICVCSFRSTFSVELLISSLAHNISGDIKLIQGKHTESFRLLWLRSAPPSRRPRRCAGGTSILRPEWQVTGRGNESERWIASGQQRWLWTGEL